MSVLRWTFCRLIRYNLTGMQESITSCIAVGLELELELATSGAVSWGMTAVVKGIE